MTHATDYDPQGTYGDPEPEALIYGVPVSLWDTWSQFTKEKYLQQYNADVSYCFTHGDGRTTCYNKDTGTWEMLAYPYTYGVDELINGEAVETGETVNELVEDVEVFLDETKETLEETWETAQETGKTVLILGALAGLALLSRGR